MAAFALMLTAGLANLGLSIYQWQELLLVRSGGTPACSINETLNCAAVWNSPFASKVHELLRVPIAGLGVVWAGAATAFAVAIFLRARRGDFSAPADAAKLWSWLGLVSLLPLIGASFSAGALCVTCLGTYVLVGAYAFGALKLLPGKMWPASNALGPALGWMLAAGALFFLFALPKGIATPRTTTVALTAGSLEDYSLALDALSPQDLMIASVARLKYQTGEAKDRSAWPVRLRLGPASAPVAMTDWTDIRCGHCKHLEGQLEEIRRLVPPTNLSIEPKHFPIDGECNPLVNKVWGDGVRCLAAKVQICLEESTKFWDVRRELFENTDQLTTAMIVDIALKTSGISEDKLRDCLASEETKKKLADDIAMAKAYDIEGTPLVLINGKETLASGPFLLGMALTRGDADAPVFKKLPPPPRE